MATKKQTLAPDEKLEKQDFDLFKALEAIDRKDYDYLESLTEEQRKKFVPYMMMHWCSAVKGKLAGYYLLSTDVHANKYFFNEKVQHHPQLQWLMLCASSPGMGKQFHQWIPHLNSKIGELAEEATVKQVSEYFTKIYKTAPPKDIKEAAETFVDSQRHKYSLAKIYPTMKLQDIEVLSTLTSKDDVKQYEQDSGM
jgi:hypothetical protein